MNQHNDQLTAGLLAQLVENCTGIAEVIDSKYRTGLNLVMFIAANIDLMFTRLVLYFLTEEGSSRGVIVLILRR